jgi:hypothetical protein
MALLALPLKEPPHKIAHKPDALAVRPALAVRAPHYDDRAALLIRDKIGDDMPSPSLNWDIAVCTTKDDAIDPWLIAGPC